ncbi:Leucine aminopeptidase [Vigna angularis]|uniref:Leucine aminopeptidase n=1 Tax=Phaseolus angularis TaxID=3914 RepID=A0A8T0KJ22_PHAAN|nr:Leucine aminopeptidase [Vigna angularis]
MGLPKTGLAIIPGSITQMQRVGLLLQMLWCMLVTRVLSAEKFVDEKVQWLHIDMDGPVWNEKQRCATGLLHAL